MAELKADLSSMSFEEALSELEKIVRLLEEGKGNLDDAILSYGRGVELKRLCETRLAEAETRVEKIMTGADGAVSAQAAIIGQG